MIRIWLIAAGIAAGVSLASFAPGLVDGVRGRMAALPGMAWLKTEKAQAGAQAHAEGPHHEEGALELSDQQIASAASRSDCSARSPSCASGSATPSSRTRSWP
jgi:hypothetical protein